MKEGKEQLRQKLAQTMELLVKAESEDERITLVNYAGALYSILEEDNPIYEKALDKWYPSYLKYSEEAEKKIKKHFVSEKDFHIRYTDEILYLTSDESEELHHIPTDSLSKRLSEKEFYAILYSFLEKYKLQDSFNKLNKNGNIHSMKKMTDRYTTGLALHNPVTKDTDLFIRKVKYCLHDLEIITHELGHAIEEQSVNMNCREHNESLFMSYYTEVTSTLLERLFLRHLIEEEIETKESQQLLIHFERENYLVLLGSNAWGLFDDKFILTNRFNHCKNKTIIKKLQHYFDNPDGLTYILNNMRNYDFTEIHQYAYGNIISLIMSDEIEQNGLLNERMEYFLQNRKPFSLKEFLEKGDYHPKQYAKNYQKEINLIKK